MMKIVSIVATACLVAQPIAAASEQSVLGAMRSFQEFCLSGDLSVETIARVAEDRHYKLVVERQLSAQKDSKILHKTWQVPDATGDFALSVTQSGEAGSGRRFQCGVTLPKGTEADVEVALKDASHFGMPDQIGVNVDGSRAIRWIRQYEWGVGTVDLATQVPRLQGGSMLNVLYQVGR
jgi:hypothetical protein